MSKFLRIALTWLLAVALPIQGYAAHAMLACGPAHHQIAVAPGHASHHHDDASKDFANAASSGGEVKDSPGASLGQQAKAVESGQVSKCSACASCCSATAITTSVLAVEVIRQQAPAVATIPAGNPADTLGGLERPPRPFFA